MAFIDRIVEYPGRYKLIDDEGNVLGVYTLERQEGEVSEEGTPLNATNLNTNINSLITSKMNGINIDANSNVKVRNIQSGSVSIKASAKSVASKTVTFPIRFTSAPKISVTPASSSPQSVHVSIASVTTTSFQIKLYRTSKGTTTVHWVAVL